MANKPRLPLRARASGTNVVDALDEMDERAQRRHEQFLTALTGLVGGMALALASVCLTAMLIVGASKGISPTEISRSVISIGSAFEVDDVDVDTGEPTIGNDPS